ncbi:MAG: glycoside hydrolase family 27 protein [Lachnospiraceae bacterium]|nr:glycoside hydrolase family 27 protein [Lachnospiraceae bacterium]
MSIAQKPPLGWNSWDCYGASATEEIIKQNADYMAKNLKQFGWEYVVLDIEWSEPTADSHAYHKFAELCMDEYSRLIPAPNRFPSSANGQGLKPLADYVHSLGLKFGLHIMRGIPRQAVHQNCKLLGTNKTARDIASTTSICMWNTEMYGVDCSQEGAKEYYESIFKLYAEWEVDYIKIDDICRDYPIEEVEMVKAALDSCGREMVLSLSPGPAQLEKAEHMKEHCNMWRITDDFWDKWELLYNMFERCEKWCIHSGAGHWPDADMLPIGPILQDYDKANRTKFTKDEQITMMTLWSIFRSPLIIGGELTGFDEFTLSLVTNEEIIDINQNSYGAHPLFRKSVNGVEQTAWLANCNNGDFALALFNLGEKETIVTAKLPVEGDYTISDCWNFGECLMIQNEVSCNIPPHGAKLYRLTRTK